MILNYAYLQKNLAHDSIALSLILISQNNCEGS